MWLYPMFTACNVLVKFLLRVLDYSMKLFNNPELNLGITKFVCCEIEAYLPDYNWWEPKKTIHFPSCFKISLAAATQHIY